MVGERRPQRDACVTALMLVLAIPRAAHAQEHAREDAARERAIASFEAARRWIAADDCTTALPLLADSLRHEPSVGAHFSFADCVEATDPYAAFWHLREAAMLSYVKRDDRLTTAEQRAEAIAAQTGGVRFRVPPADLAAPGFDLRLDGATIDRFHLAGAIAAAPGEHSVVARSADGRRFERSVRVDRESVTIAEVALALPPTVQQLSPPPSVREAPRARDAPSGRKTLAVAIGAAGASALALGTAFGVLTIERRDELDRACNGDADACTGAASVVDPVLASAERSATASTVLFAVGGGLLAAAAYFWLTTPSAPSAARAARPLVLGLRW